MTDRKSSSGDSSCDCRHTATSVTIECKDVRRDPDGGLCWTLRVHRNDREGVVFARSLASGFVVDLQGRDTAGTTGDPEVDHAVVRWIERRLAWHRISRAIEGAR